MHGRSVTAILVLLVLSGVALAQAPAAPAKVLKESWEVIYIENAKVGHAHTLCTEYPQGARTLVKATLKVELNVRRLNQEANLAFSVADFETADGKVLTFGYQQTLNGQQNLLHTGEVDNDNQLVTIKTTLGSNRPVESKMKWDEQTIGLYTESRLFQNRKLEPNTDFDYLIFMPDFKRIFRFHVELKDFEEVKLLQGEKRRLLRLEKKVAEKVEGVPLPTEVDWIDEKGEPVKRSVSLPAIGQLTYYRTTEAIAKARGDAAAVDLGANQLVRVNRQIQRPDEAREVVYRIKLTGVEDPGKAFAADDRQEIRNLQGEQFEMVVHGIKTPSGNPPPNKAEAPEEYLKSNHFIRSDDALVRELSRRAVGNELDPWEKAQRIERWVYGNMQKRDLTQTFTAADQVARELDGDCRQHAVLAAAMCRAAGVPSRTVLGLVYSPDDRAMIFHMWIEVWVGGKWYALDPTRGQGRVAADHLKIADQHWNGETSLRPFIAVYRVVGKVQIDVGNVQYDSR
jgi:transglutaminase-like putative cysteine protease